MIKKWLYLLVARFIEKFLCIKVAEREDVLKDYPEQYDRTLYTPYQSPADFLKYYYQSEKALEESNPTASILCSHGFYLCEYTKEDPPRIFDVAVVSNEGLVSHNRVLVPWDVLSNRFTFLDKTPCGEAPIVTPVDPKDVIVEEGGVILPPAQKEEQWQNT